MYEKEKISSPDSICLTRQQESCLREADSRSLMIQGYAGAGKSIVLKAITLKYAKSCPKEKKHVIGFFTFNNTLLSVVKESLNLSDMQTESVFISTVNTYILQVYRAMGGPKFFIPAGEEWKKKLVQKALDNYKEAFGFHRFCKLDLQFFIDEFNWMKNMNITPDDREIYLNLPRKGRGEQVRMSKLDRITTFELFTYYEHLVKENHLGDWTDYALYLSRNPEKIPEEWKFDVILIDEAQDLSLAQIKAVLTLSRKNVYIAMDMNQRIYNRYWTPKMLGIDSSIKRLTQSMRTTIQIDNLAESVRKHNDSTLGDNGLSSRIIPQKEGPIPKLIRLEDEASEKKYIIEQVKTYLKQKSSSIGIIAATNKQVELYSSWMTDGGIPHEKISRDSTFSLKSSGVKIVNIFNAKGLEFTRVVIPQFMNGIFPRHFQSNDLEDIEDFLRQSRNHVYVAMTRAVYSLLITYHGEEGSPFIGEMDSQYYNSENTTVFYESFSGIGKGTIHKKIELPPTAPIPTMTVKTMTLSEFFQGKGLTVIDKRSTGGDLWLVGEKNDLKPCVNEAQKIYGAYGSYTADGGLILHHQPGWHTKCKK